MVSFDTLDAVESGLPVSSLEEAADRFGLTTLAVVRTLGMSERTFARRKADAVLTVEESDRLMRLFRLLDRAEVVVGDRDRARRWLNTANRGLDGRAPLSMASTETGAAMVFDLLGRIEHGVFS